MTDFDKMLEGNHTSYTPDGAAYSCEAVGPDAVVLSIEWAGSTMTVTIDGDAAVQYAHGLLAAARVASAQVRADNAVAQAYRWLENRGGRAATHVGE